MSVGLFGSLKGGYRSEIDGLRAIAVVSVIFAHSGINIFPGGFVGVDVFFVLSGYLITGIILREIELGEFSFMEFYSRRARRILPALFVVLLASLFMAFFLMTPSQYKDYAISQASVVIFLSNAYFWGVLDYFSPNALEQPLLHTWSLAVEEQYYLIYPLLLVLAWQFFGKRIIPVLLFGLALLSFLIGEWGWRNKPDFNFFFSLSRFWELLAGGLVLVWERFDEGGYSEAWGWGGIVLIIASIFFLDENIPFPSYYTLIPVIGTVLVLFHVRNGGRAAQFLSYRWLSLIGLISYSAYLWHQPIFAFARLSGYYDSSFLVVFLFIALTFLLAYITWRWIEVPFRGVGGKERVLGLRAGVAAGVCGMFLFAVGISEQYVSTTLWRYDPLDLPLVSVSRKEAKSYLHRRSRSYEGRDFSRAEGRNVLIIGDSYGKDLLNAIHEIGFEKELNLSLHVIPADCGNIYLKGERYFLLPQSTPACNKVDRYQSDDLISRIALADVIVLASSWRLWQVEYLKESIDNLKGITDATIIVMGTKNLGVPNLKNLLKLSWDERLSARDTPGAEILKINKVMENLGLANFINIQKLMCQDGVRCPVVSSEGYIYSEDGGHLTASGARYMGEVLRNKSDFFRKLLGE